MAKDHRRLAEEVAQGVLLDDPTFLKEIVKGNRREDATGVVGGRDNRARGCRSLRTPPAAYDLLPKIWSSYDESGAAQGGLPNSQGGAVVRRRAPSGFKADHPQSMESHRTEATGQGPSALRVDLPLRLRTPENRKSPLALHGPPLSTFPSGTLVRPPPSVNSCSPYPMTSRAAPTIVSGSIS